MHLIVSLYQAALDHPGYIQAFLAIVTTSGVFEFVKRRVALEGKARIAGWLSAVGALSVMIHMAIVGLPALSAVHFIKLTAQETFTYLGILNLVYAFITTKVATFLEKAKAMAEARKLTDETSDQKNQAAIDRPAVESGVAQF